MGRRHLITGADEGQTDTPADQASPSFPVRAMLSGVDLIYENDAMGLLASIN